MITIRVSKVQTRSAQEVNNLQKFLLERFAEVEGRHPDWEGDRVSFSFPKEMPRPGTSKEVWVEIVGVGAVPLVPEDLAETVGSTLRRKFPGTIILCDVDGRRLYCNDPGEDRKPKLRDLEYVRDT